MSGATGGFLLLSALPAAADPQGHTTICHATGSNSNPYVVNNPANPGVNNGHAGHQNGEDVIPAPDGAQRGPTHGSQQCEEEQTPPTPPEEHGQPPVNKPPLQGAQPPVAQHQPQSAPVAQAAPVANAPASRPIPNAVSAGSNTAADWQLPAGSALIVLGAAGVAGALVRRASARD
jgi:hypothetical protein